MRYSRSLTTWQNKHSERTGGGLSSGPLFYPGRIKRMPVFVHCLKRGRNLAFAIVVLSGYIKGLPVELEEAAYMEGAHAGQIFFQIIVPLTKPSFATVGIFSFLWSYNDLFTQSFFLRLPKQRSITYLLNEISGKQGTDYGLMAASVCMIVVPLLIVYVCLQKYIIKGMTAGAVKG